MRRAPSPPSSWSQADDDEGPSERALRCIADDASLIGQLLDQRYRIEAVLGAGGVGVVYRAEHTGLRRPVALKVLRHGCETVPHLRRRFEREARVLSQLSHPNVVGLTDYGIAEGSAEGSPYLVMELLEGRTLEAMLKKEGPPAPRVAVEIARAVIRGLAFAHDRGVLHRDLKPANVFLQVLPDEPNHVKLLDFGLAKLLVDEEARGNAGEPTLTKVGTIVGTPAYMSPEQASGGRVDPRSDVYAAGVVLFELLVGRAPFEAARRADLLRAHLVEPVPDPERLRPGLVLAPEVRSLLSKCLAKEASDRFPDARALLAAIDRLTPDAVRFEPEGERARTDPRRTLQDASSRVARSSSSPWFGAGVVAALACAVGVVWGIADVATEVATVEPSTRSDGPTAATATTATTQSSAASARSASASNEMREPPIATASASATAIAVATASASASATASARAGVEGPTTALLSDDVDPFATAMPPALEELARALSDAPGDRRTHRAMRLYQRQRPNDPRPSLLLAHDFASRGAWPQAFERYQLALRRHAASIHDPRMLDDLLQAAQVEAHAATAREMLVRLFRDSARPRVRDLLAGSEDRSARVLLRALAAALESADG